MPQLTAFYSIYIILHKWLLINDLIKELVVFLYVLCNFMVNYSQLFLAIAPPVIRSVIVLLLAIYLINKYYSLPSVKNNGITLKSVVAPIPCIVAVNALQVVCGDIETALNIMDNTANIAPHDILSNLQNWHHQLTDALNLHCKHANSQLTHWNSVPIKHTYRYHTLYSETSAFYNSLWLHNCDVLNSLLVRRILELTNCGVINDDSYTHSGILKENRWQFKAAWQQAYERWRRDYINREPLYPVTERNVDLDYF